MDPVDPWFTLWGARWVGWKDEEEKKPQASWETRAFRLSNEMSSELRKPKKYVQKEPIIKKDPPIEGDLRCHIYQFLSVKHILLTIALLSSLERD